VLVLGWFLLARHRFSGPPITRIGAIKRAS
jgi:hypothetical protein